MTNTQWVFDKAIHLMDEQDERSGETLTEDTQEYKNRTLSIVNVLRNDLYPMSDNYTLSENGRRPVLPMLVDFEQEIGLDDVIAQSILPYGLAAHLLLGEDNSKAGFFNQKYEELKMSLGSKRAAVWEDIPDSFM